MYERKTVGVVVTAYNEAGHVGEVIDTIPEFVDRTYVVDDCSTDDTWDVVRRHAERANSTELSAPVADGGADFTPPVVTIRHEENRGYGGAVKTGYRRALEDDVDVVAVMNGDGQMDPDILDRIVDPVATDVADYAKGNRLLSPAHWGQMTRWRLTGNALLTLLTKFASGYWKTMDTQNGYTAISADALRRIDLGRLYEEHGFLNDLLMELNSVDARVADVEMTARYGDEESSIRYRSFVPNLSLLLLQLFLRRLVVKHLLTDFHPMIFLYGLGSFGLLTSATAAGYGALLAQDTGLYLGLALLIFLVSGVALTCAMAFDMYESAPLERQIFRDDAR
jgi:glycosyltransferase involved in cell wall biosynthesis